MSLFIQGDIIRKPVCGTASFVDIDQGIYVPAVKKFIRNLSVEQIGGMLSCAESRQRFFGESPVPCLPKASMANRKLILSCRFALVKFNSRGTSSESSGLRQTSI